MRRQEHPDDTRFYKGLILVILNAEELTRTDWEIMFSSLTEDLENRKIYRPTAKWALHLVKIKLNEFDNIKEENRIRLIELNNAQLLQVLETIKDSPNYIDIKHKIKNILYRSKNINEYLASVLA